MLSTYYHLKFQRVIYHFHVYGGHKTFIILTIGKPIIGGIQILFDKLIVAKFQHRKKMQLL